MTNDIPGPGSDLFNTLDVLDGMISELSELQTSMLLIHLGLDALRDNPKKLLKDIDSIKSNYS